METILFSMRYERWEYFYLEEPIQGWRKLRYEEMISLEWIKPRNIRRMRHVKPTGKIKYVNFGRKTLSELDLFFDQTFIQALRNVPVLQNVKTCSGAHPASYSARIGSRPAGT